MAESDEAEVDYCSVLNVRKEVKIVFQGERKSKIFYQSCKVHFIAFQTNENVLRAAYNGMSWHVHVVSPGQTSRSREKESRVKKA